MPRPTLATAGTALLGLGLLAALALGLLGVQLRDPSADPCRLLGMTAGVGRVEVPAQCVGAHGVPLGACSLARHTLARLLVLALDLLREGVRGR